ncbi:CPBP family intramembrane metalloprotease [Candidatus Saccharibacteria bacterium]|nr:CPBP family intramembrane metalloprotease [Candidatus Saccharibacteria bacterium]
MNKVLVLVLSIVSLHGLLSFFVRRKRRESDLVDWSPIESVSVTFFIYFFSQLFAGFIIFGLLSLTGWNESRIDSWYDSSVVGQFILTCVVQALTVVLLIKFLHRRKSRLATVGLSGRPNWSNLKQAIAGYVAYMTFYIIVAIIVDRFLPSVDLNQKQQIGYDDVSSSLLPLVFINLVILPPLVEELMVRGFLYTGLKQKLPKIQAIIITSIIFATAHLQAGSSAPLLWVAGIDTFILSIVLIRLREQSGSLWPPIILHALKNLVAFMSLFVFHLV